MYEPGHADPSADERVVARLIGDDPPVPDWLQRMSVSAVREGSGWKIIAIGETALARFYGPAETGARRSSLPLTL